MSGQVVLNTSSFDKVLKNIQSIHAKLDKLTNNINKSTNNLEKSLKKSNDYLTKMAKNSEKMNKSFINMTKGLTKGGISGGMGGLGFRGGLGAAGAGLGPLAAMGVLFSIAGIGANMVSKAYSSSSQTAVSINTNRGMYLPFSGRGEKAFQQLLTTTKSSGNLYSHKLFSISAAERLGNMMSYYKNRRTELSSKIAALSGGIPVSSAAIDKLYNQNRNVDILNVLAKDILLPAYNKGTDIQKGDLLKQWGEVLGIDGQALKEELKLKNINRTYGKYNELYNAQTDVNYDRLAKYNNAIGEIQVWLENKGADLLEKILDMIEVVAEWAKKGAIYVQIGWNETVKAISKIWGVPDEWGTTAQKRLDSLYQQLDSMNNKGKSNKQPINQNTSNINPNAYQQFIEANIPQELKKNHADIYKKLINTKGSVFSTSLTNDDTLVMLDKYNDFFMSLLDNPLTSSANFSGWSHADLQRAFKYYIRGGDEGVKNYRVDALNKSSKYFSRMDNLLHSYMSNHEIDKVTRHLFPAIVTPTTIKEHIDAMEAIRSGVGVGRINKDSNLVELMNDAEDFIKSRFDRSYKVMKVIINNNNVDAANASTSSTQK